MSLETALRGACSCGRNHYLISVPPSPLETLQVLYDDSTEHSRALSLRVPLARLQSTTYAFYPDETHNTIRRVFTPQNAPQTKRHFCGICGTSLSHWSEESPEEAEWIYVNMGSLKRESIERLEDAGLLSNPAESVAIISQGAADGSRIMASNEGREVKGVPWFEELIEGSELGRIKRRRGGKSSADGRATVEWEVTEFESSDGAAAAVGGGKRKLGSLGEGDDVEMRSG